MKQINLGTIGSGMIVKAMMANVAKTQGIRLTAVYSRSAETAAALAESFGADSAYTDLDAFLADPVMDYVYIASPNSLHYPQAKKALLAGKNVILEKPFCTCAAHARELFDIARERGLVLVEAVPPAFLPNLPILRAALPKIGRIRLVQGNFSQYSSRYDALLAGQTPNVFNPALGGGCLMDINFYNIWLNTALFGKAHSIRYFPNRHENGIDTSGVAILDYGDFISTASGAKDTWGENFFLIEGEKGYIHIPLGPSRLNSIRLVTKDSDTTESLQPDANHWLYEVRELTRILLDGDTETLAQMEQLTLAVQETLEEARLGAGIRFPGE